jgi:hypothetical protein
MTDVGRLAGLQWTSLEGDSSHRALGPVQTVQAVNPSWPSSRPVTTRQQAFVGGSTTQRPAQQLRSASVATAVMFGFAARAGMQALRATASNRNAQLMAMRSFAAAAEGGSGVS